MHSDLTARAKVAMFARQKGDPRWDLLVARLSARLGITVAEVVRNIERMAAA